jgi:hypothetical protein
MTNDEKILLIDYIETWIKFIESNLKNEKGSDLDCADHEFAKRWQYYIDGKNDAFENAQLILGYIKDKVSSL